jgi:hypothetical protein
MARPQKFRPVVTDPNFAFLRFPDQGESVFYLARWFQQTLAGISHFRFHNCAFLFLMQTEKSGAGGVGDLQSKKGNAVKRNAGWAPRT